MFNIISPLLVKTGDYRFGLHLSFGQSVWPSAWLQFGSEVEPSVFSKYKEIHCFYPIIIYWCCEADVLVKGSSSYILYISLLFRELITWSLKKPHVISKSQLPVKVNILGRLVC